MAASGPAGATANSATSDGATSGSAAANAAIPGRATAESAAWGSRPAAWTGDEEAGLRRDEPEEDALNLFDVAAGPIFKRALPALAATVLLIWVGTRIRLRGRGRRASSP
jgi:hypothetical protein